MKGTQSPDRDIVKRGRDKRGPQHASLPRIPTIRQTRPSNHGQWMHYRVVPGLRKLIYIESRSGENGCIFVSKVQNLRLQSIASDAGFENPLEMLKGLWMKRFGLEGRAAA